MRTVHCGIAFVVSLAATVAMCWLVIRFNPDADGIIDIRGKAFGEIALPLALALGFAALFWFGLCRRPSVDRKVYFWFVTILNIVAFGFLGAALISRVVARQPAVPANL